MDWTLCLLCALISMASTRCHEYIPSSYHQYEQKETNHDRLGEAQQASVQEQATQRISVSEEATYQISESDRNTQRIREWVNQASQRLSERDDIATQRMSERSLPLDSGRQRLQELQRRRFNQEDESPRIVNVNKNSGFHLTPRRGVVPDPTVSPDVVVFPGPSRRSDQTPFVPAVPEECLRTGICEDLPDYPEERVAAIIETLGNATDKYKVDELDTPEIAQRIGPPEEMELCEFSLKVAVPKAAPDKEGKWHYILNQKDKPLQGFQVEICSKADSPCSKVAYFYSGYEANCKQKFMLRYMAGLNEKGEMVVVPKAAPDKDGNWHYILNQKDKPLQGFHVEICKEDKSPCAKLAHFYSGYEATCKQKYMLRYMAGLDANGQMVEKAFKLPSCCSCVVRQTD